MAHSYLDFRGNDIHLSDSNIFIVMNWLAIIRQRGVCEDSLGSLFSWWSSESIKLAPGCIEIPLDSFLQDDQRIEVFRNLLKQLEIEIDRFEGEIPGKTLNEIVGGTRFVFEDQYSNNIKKSVTDFLQLVSPGG